MSRPELRTPRTPRLSRLSRPARANLIALPLLIVVGLVWIYPFLWIVAGAFKTQTGLFTGGASLMPDQWNFDNFRRAWVDAGFSRYFFNTILYAVVSTVIELFKSALCGYIMARYEFPGRKFLHRMIIATLFVPVASIIAVVVIFQFITNWNVWATTGPWSSVSKGHRCTSPRTTPTTSW